MFGSLSLATATVVDAAFHVFDGSDRRLRKVESDPRLATVADVEALVRAHGVTETAVWTVVDRVESAHLDPAAVWNWTVARDAADLADLIGTSLDDAELAAFIEGGFTVTAMAEVA